MRAIISPSKVSGTISAPASKSFTHRAIILASLAVGRSVVKNALISDDTKATINACKSLGAKIDLRSKNIEIEGVNGQFPEKKSPTLINCGMSGTTIRLMTAVSVLSPGEIILTGEKRLKERPVGELVRVLKSLGVDIKASRNNQFPPIKMIGGDFAGGKITVSGDISSQFISALLLIAPFAQNELAITVKNLKSAPYVDITVDLMKTFGVNISKAANTFHINSGQKYIGREYTVEGDFTSASYFFAAAVLTDSNVSVKNLNPNSVQGDKYFLKVLKKIKRNKLQRTNFNLGNYPDIVPTVSVVAANVSGETVINNIKHLRTKESDRIHSVASQLSKMGIKVKATSDAMFITGGKLKGATITTFNDHRIAMSFAVAGLVADGQTVINNAEVVNKSYPDFWKDLQKIGAKIKIIN